MKKALSIIICTLLCVFLTSVPGRAEEPRQEGQQGEEKEKPVALEEITVFGTPYMNPITPVNTPFGTQYNLVTEEQIRKQNAYDFQSTLRDVPGVMFQSKNLMGSQTSHSIYIRGRGASHPSPDIVIQYDGVPRFGALFGQVLGDGIAVSTIGGVEIYKSPQPSQFGSGYAMINVLPKYLREEGREVIVDSSAGSHGTFSESLSGGIRQGPYDAYISQSWASTDGHVDHSRAQQENYYANLGYQLNRIWSLRFLINHVESQTLAPMPEVTPTATNGVSWPGAERYDTDTTFTTLTLAHQYEEVNGYLKAYWNETDFDLLQELTNGQRYGKGTGGLWSRQEITQNGIRAREDLALWTGGEILAGVDMDWTALKNTQRTYSGQAVAGINGGKAERVWDFPNTMILSPYLAVSQKIGCPEGFHITPSAGFRYYRHNEFEDVSSPHAGLSAGYGNTDLHFNYARGVNYPSPVVVMNLVLEGSSVSDPGRYWKDLKPEVVDHYEVGLTHTWPETASLGATAFYDKGKDRFQAYMFGAIPTQFNDLIGKYEIRGLELTGTVTPLKDLELTAGATWMEAKATGSDGIERDKMPYTPSFQFQAGVNWKFLERFRLFMDVQHLRNVYAATSSRTATFKFTELTDANRLDNMTVANARLSYRFDCEAIRLKDSEAFLAVNNIFNTEYEYAKGYTMPGITVFAGVSLKFN
jgi:iron complex outermembrane receptor protein